MEWPLWGLRLEDRPAGLEGMVALADDAHLYQPTWTMWADMEQRDVVDEHAGREVASERLGLAVGRRPPVCHMRLSSVGPDGEPTPSFGEQENGARDLFDALRLYAPGDFVDPGETCSYVTHPSGMTTRAVGPFRSAFYRLASDDPYTFATTDAGHVAALAHWAGVVRRGSAHANASIAIENFRLSFGHATEAAERGLHRFIALEAVLGSVGGSVSGASFVVRATHAAVHIVPEAQGWLMSARELRNRLAHPAGGTSPPEEGDLAMLEDVTRGVLVSYLSHIAGGDHDRPLQSFNHALAKGPILTE